MTNDNDHDATAGQTASGQGRLAAVIATRGGVAAPEAPFVIEHREALIYMLCEAAELEHAIMCQYLFAAFSLKQAADEGLGEAELDAVQRWRKQVSHVAAQEMLHLALVQNILSAIGAAPHMSRPNLPAPASHYPAGVRLALLPFGEQALKHFMFLERPEGMDLDDADGLAAMAAATPVLNKRDIVPRGQDFKTVGHLYRSIEAGLARLVVKHGEDWLFVGPPRAQATPKHFGWPELVAVTDLASAQRAIDEILEQGEGPRGNWRDAHFGQFVAILDEYQRLSAANPGFDPVRSVIAANVRQPERDVEVPLISDLLTARVADLFNVGYEILLQIFERFFAHTEETDEQLQVLADATVALMLRVIKPLGDVITTLPVGAEHPGKTAGPSFELFYETDYLMPHRDAAWALLAERLDEASWLCDQVQIGRGTAISARLTPVQGVLRDVARSLAAQLPSTSSHASLAAKPAALAPAELADLVSWSNELAASAGNAGGELGSLFAAARSTVTAAANLQGCDPSEQAVIAPRLVASVLRPLAGALFAAAQNGPGRGASPGPAMPAPTEAEAPGAADLSARVWDLAKSASALRTRLGGTADCPPELAEATAALQDLSIQLAPPGKAATRLEELWQLQAALPTTVQAEHNGPYLVTNVPTLLNYLGGASRPAPQLALCRCGASAIKPRCDGSHARTGFSDEKDPKRVPDRRDTYPGQQLTIFDNRGICQHSGLCTDRLATVFRTSAEPFVAPSGGRMDEIVRAVRDCPSGALSFAIDGTEARDEVDWNDTRPPAIEVTKDGPYRITGAISLLTADGQPAARAEGSSLEHYALCRCGHSQNKPYCSGMHWYVGFTDPLSEDGHESTPFEWAGGLPALTRLARLLYEKHIPADESLAPAFAAMPADQAERLARWLTMALGGPTSGAPDSNISAAVGLTGWDAGDGQRARWVSLVSQAADEARLPQDPSFRAVFASCVEWTSRAVGAGPAPLRAAPRWDWGPAGPPAPTPAAANTEVSGPDDTLPGPTEAVGFAAHIKPLFRERDRQSMSFALDLWSYDDVRSRSAEILARLQDGSMPCDGAWPEARTTVFKRWIDTGMRP
ncbi:MAG TPA: ferritin-like domain-containing protein [Streptosporangiaceae bacterium]|nr:ferritin-like domain-containing protein [Streptosporangiaceae bacterium]